MNDFKYVSDDYNINKTITYRLSIQLNPDGFSVLIADAHKNILFLLHRKGENFGDNLSEFKDNMDLYPVTNLRFARSVILVNTTEFTLVPSEYYSEDLRELYIRFSHPLMDFEQVMTNRLENPDARLLFKLKEKHIGLIKSFHNSPAIVHSSVPYLEYIMTGYQGEDGLFIHHTGNLLSLSRTRNNQLELHNIIEAVDDNDITYHTLNTFKHLGMNRDSDKILYSGTLNENSEAVNILSRYIGQIVPLKNEFPFELAGDLNENYFINLLKSTGCV
ncbi:MAG TPA: DUF3822 family protein [Bacteroidales bacterium]|nr:DUF3822 family protein [Bacteroidales bacterium]